MIPAGSTRYITLMSMNNQTPLPVELTSFTARPQGTAVQLNWTTATEQNNAYFGVERSADGINWQQIGKVNGAGNSTQPLSYGYTDQQPLNGTSYYRLKQTDYNGTFKYSLVEVVRLQNSNPTLRVYPNPVGQEVTIQTSKAVVQINLLSTNGRTVLRHAPSRVAGGTFSINMHSVQRGIYLLQVINKDGSTDVIKLIKQ
ncbi:MAG: T9SS type A sorting domain-containing protein [Agriterribacter sp.]